MHRDRARCPLRHALLALRHPRSLWQKHLQGAALLQGNAAMCRLLVQHLIEGSAPTGADGRPWTRSMLSEWVSKTLFRVGVGTVLGSGLDIDALWHSFSELDADFPLVAATLPRWLQRFTLRKAWRARDVIGAALAAQLADPAADVRPLLRERQAHFLELGFDAKTATNLSVLLVWALHANTQPIAMWTLAHLLAQPAALAAVRGEVDAAFDASPHLLRDADKLGAALDSCRLLTSCMWEATRWCASAFGLRDVVADTTLRLPRLRTQVIGEGGARGAAGTGAGDDGGDDGDAFDLHLRAGDRVFLAATHHMDADVFEEPERFKHDRFAADPVTGKAKTFTRRSTGREVRTPVLAFGGGVSMCPGRFLAINEVRLFVAVVLRHYEVRLEVEPDALPPLNRQRAGLGTLPPAYDIPFSFRRRDLPRSP